MIFLSFREWCSRHLRIPQKSVFRNACRGRWCSQRGRKVRTYQFRTISPFPPSLWPSAIIADPPLSRPKFSEGKFSLSRNRFLILVVCSVDFYWLNFSGRDGGGRVGWEIGEKNWNSGQAIWKLPSPSPYILLRFSSSEFFSNFLHFICQTESIIRGQALPCKHALH